MRKKTLACALALAIAAPGLAIAQDNPPPMGASILMWSPEQQKSGYKSMEQLTAHKVVRRGPEVFALPPGQPIDAKLSIPIGGKRLTLDEYMAAYRVSGLLVIKDGKVVL